MSLSSYTKYFQESRDSQFENSLECEELIDISILVDKIFWEDFKLIYFTIFQEKKEHHHHHAGFWWVGINIALQSSGNLCSGKIN